MAETELSLLHATITKSRDEMSVVDTDTTNQFLDLQMTRGWRGIRHRWRRRGNRSAPGWPDQYEDQSTQSANNKEAYDAQGVAVLVGLDVGEVGLDEIVKGLGKNAFRKVVDVLQSDFSRGERLWTGNKKKNGSGNGG